MARMMPAVFHRNGTDGFTVPLMMCPKAICPQPIYGRRIIRLTLPAQPMPIALKARWSAAASERRLWAIMRHGARRAEHAREVPRLGFLYTAIIGGVRSADIL